MAISRFTAKLIVTCTDRIKIKTTKQGEQFRGELVLVPPVNDMLLISTENFDTEDEAQNAIRKIFNTLLAHKEEILNEDS